MGANELWRMRRCAGDAGVEPGGVRLRAASTGHGVSARGGRGLRRHPGAGGPPRPADAAGRPGEAPSTSPRPTGPRSSRLYLYRILHLQTRFVTKLLIEKYGFPKKFVEGADKALNKKK